MEKLVMKGASIRKAPNIPVIYTMAGVVNTVALREKGLAYSIYYYVTNMKPNKAVKMIAIEGVTPSPETIGAIKYPLTAEVYAVIRKGTSKKSSASMLRDWLLSANGQAAILESGYVPIPGKNGR